MIMILITINTNKSCHFKNTKKFLFHSYRLSNIFKIASKTGQCNNEDRAKHATMLSIDENPVLEMIELNMNFWLYRKINFKIVYLQAET